MNYLGIDFGEKRIGLALGSKKVAAPLTTLEYKDLERVLLEIKRICLEGKIEKIILGLPLDSEGKIGSQARRVEEFKKVLKKRVNLPIELWDETLSTQNALSYAIELGVPQKKRRHLDAIAAALTLQRYLDRSYARQ